MNIIKVMKLNVFVFCALIIIATNVCVASLVWTCPICKTEFQFPSNASSYRNAFAQRHLAECRSAGSTNAFSYGGATGDPVFDAMMPMFNSLFEQAGKSIAEELFGNPEQQRQQAELRRIEQQRLQELERRRREEMARLRKELHEKLLAELMLLDSTGDLSLITLSGDSDLALAGDDRNGQGDTLELMGMDDGLRPAGTSFFGLGGGNTSEGDEEQVSLQNLRRAAYLVQKAQDASTTEAEFLIDEGLRTATGHSSFGAIDDQAIPVVSEEGLLAFQKANNDYRRARDFHMQTSERFAKDNAQYERARVLYEKAKEELEQQAGPEGIDPQKQQTMSRLYNRLRELYQTRLRTKVTLESTENDLLWTEARRRLTLKETVVPEPSTVADILERERQHLKPSIVDRLAHAHRRNVAEVYAREFDQFLQEHYRFVDDPILLERVQGLTERVKALSPYPDEPIQVRIIARSGDREAPGAYEQGVWSTSDTLYYGIGYLEKEPSDDAILFTAGHEIAHVQRDHYIEYIDVRENVAANIAPETLVDWETSALSEDDKRKIRDAAYNAALQDLNHEQEFEADRLGAFMALSAGAKPSAFREVFGHDEPSASDNEERHANRKLRELTSTHPRDSIRLEKLREIYGTAIDKAPMTKKETNK